MKWAQVGENKIVATPKAQGTCPLCGSEVIAKCGEILAWHWAHKVKDCDLWSEPESEWHRGWKAKFPARWQECTIGCHRADVVSPVGIVEFQRSFLSAADIKERESFYRTMLWVVDASSWLLKRQRRHGQEHDLEVFLWSRPRKSWFNAFRPVYLDIGPGCCHVFLVLKVKIEKKHTFLITKRMLRQNFLRMCYALPNYAQALIAENSSFDHAGFAMRQKIALLKDALLRQRQIRKNTNLREHSFFANLPLFALQSAP